MGTRQQKLARQLQRDMAEILDHEARTQFSEAMISVMEVKLTPDLGYAKVYLSIYNSPDDKAVLEALNEDKVKLRQALALRIRHQVRKIPELSFYHDDTHDKASRIDALLNSISKTDNPSESEK